MFKTIFSAALIGFVAAIKVQEDAQVGSPPTFDQQWQQMFGNATEVDEARVIQLFVKDAGAAGEDTAKAAEEAKKEFKRADNSGDGKVTKAELEAYFKAESARRAKARAEAAKAEAAKAKAEAAKQGKQ